MSKRLPEWLKVRLPGERGELMQVAARLRKHKLNTVCTGARCPNLAECWASGTATIMILGRECTRNCRYCAVPTAVSPAAPDYGEPDQVALAIADLGLKYAVITSVTRDDLPDGGAAHFAATVVAIKARAPATKVELLIPDFRGDEEALRLVINSGADLIGHNLETVRRLTATVRDRSASYQQSLDVLAWLAGHGAVIKTALLLGLGESRTEIEETLTEAYEAGVRHVALGQYLAPSRDHVPVVRYWTPDEFTEFGNIATRMGYLSAASGPLVRSSYKAEEFAGVHITRPSCGPLPVPRPP
jgi:lipoyl synthase